MEQYNLFVKKLLEHKDLCAFPLEFNSGYTVTISNFDENKVNLDEYKVHRVYTEY